MRFEVVLNSVHVITIYLGEGIAYLPDTVCRVELHASVILTVFICCVCFAVTAVGRIVSHAAKERRKFHPQMSIYTGPRPLWASFFYTGWAKTGPLCFMGCNFRSIDHSGTKFGTN